MIEKIVEFIKPYYEDRYHEKIRLSVEKHLQQGTYDYACDKSGLVAVVLWILREDGRTIHVRELIIRPDWRRRGLLRDFLLRVLYNNPNLEVLSFARLRKGSGRIRRYDIRNFLRRTHERQ